MRLSPILLVLLSTFSTACEKKPTTEATPPPAPEPAPAPLPTRSSARAVFSAAPIEKVEVPEVRIHESGPTTVRVTWTTPKGTAVNDDAPFRVRWNRSDGLVDAPADVRSNGSAVKEGFKVDVQPMKGASRPSLAGEIDIVVCDAATHAVCVPVRRNVELGFIAAKDAIDPASVAIPLPEARGH